MDNLAGILFLCVAVPLALSLGIFEKKSRLTMAFMLVGMAVCLLISQVNNYLLTLFQYDSRFVTTTITPVTEEIIKALPVLYYAFVFSDDKKTLTTVSFALGLGFAIYENLIILLTSGQSVTLLWALVRGFCAGLMHGLCTMAVGQCIAYVHKKRKIFVCGTFALLSLAIIYHSIYNCLVQSEYQILGFMLPVVTYIPLFLIVRSQEKTSN